MPFEYSTGIQMFSLFEYRTLKSPNSDVSDIQVSSILFRSQLYSDLTKTKLLIWLQGSTSITKIHHTTALLTKTSLNYFTVLYVNIVDQFYI